jgi:hypothetical protein
MNIIADPERVPTYALRFFLRLMADYDLSRYKVLHMQRMIENFGADKHAIGDAIATLVAVGILEEGPLGKIRGKKRLLSTYRIRPRMMVTPDQMKDWFRESREREEREALIPGQQFGPQVVVT